jgi:hypothetical protein
VVRIKGRDGKILHRKPNRQEYCERQGQEHQSMQAPPARVGWPGGPIDVSLLTRYEQHVSRYIWFGQVTNCLFCCYLLSYIDEVIIYN